MTKALGDTLPVLDDAAYEAFPKSESADTVEFKDKWQDVSVRFKNQRDEVSSLIAEARKEDGQ